MPARLLIAEALTEPPRLHQSPAVKRRTSRPCTPRRPAGARAPAPFPSHRRSRPRSAMGPQPLCLIVSPPDRRPRRLRHENFWRYCAYCPAPVGRLLPRPRKERHRLGDNRRGSRQRSLHQQRRQEVGQSTGPPRSAAKAGRSGVGATSPLPRVPAKVCSPFRLQTSTNANRESRNPPQRNSLLGQVLRRRLQWWPAPVG